MIEYMGILITPSKRHKRSPTVHTTLAEINRLCSLPGQNRGLRPSPRWGFVSAAFQSHQRREAEFGQDWGDRLAVNVVLHGSVIYREGNGRLQRLGPGHVFHRYPKRAHRTLVDAETDYREFFLVFDGLTGQFLLELGIVSANAVCKSRLDGGLLNACRDFLDFLKQPVESAPRSAIFLKAVDLLGVLYAGSETSGRQDFWDRAIESASRMAGDPASATLNPAAIAKRCGMSYSTFRRQFRSRQGESFTRFRIRRRLEEACRLLPDHPVKEVAARLGYADPFTFSAQFKQFYGQSPRSFLRKLNP